MSESEQESEPDHIPIGIGQVLGRLNDRLPRRQQYLYADAAGYRLVDLSKAKVLDRAQIETIARETGAICPVEVIVYPG